MKKKKRYVGEGLKWFVDFLPKEIFYSFNEEEHKNYQGYRNYQSKIGMSSVKISNYQILSKKNSLKSRVIPRIVVGK
jgi:hypothetical protein